MTTQDKLFDRFPDAEARQTPPILQHGADHPIEVGYWAIFAGPEFDAQELGRGMSEVDAWSDAAALQGIQPG